MWDRLVTLKTAKLAKEVGFDMDSPAFYGCDEPASGKPGNELIIADWKKAPDIGRRVSQKGTVTYLAPTQSMLKTWLRKRHGLHVHVAVSAKDCYFPMNEFEQDGAVQMAGPQRFQNFAKYETALEHGLQYAILTILQNRKNKKERLKNRNFRAGEYKPVIIDPSDPNMKKFIAKTIKAQEKIKDLQKIDPDLGRLVVGGNHGSNTD